MMSKKKDRYTAWDIVYMTAVAIGFGLMLGYVFLVWFDAW